MSSSPFDSNNGLVIGRRRPATGSLREREMA